MMFVENDGGRAEAGFKGDTGDCVTRAIAIATGVPYREVYDALHEAALSNRALMARLELRYGAQARRHASPRTGAYRKVYQPYLESLGWVWTPVMKIGSGCTMHLRDGEVPDGRVIVSVSRHMCAVIDGVIHDTHDPSREGQRCIYGFYKEATP
jgi:hypothetical protein